VASIPFLRNLAEYVGNNDTFEKLTSLLHIKNETKTIEVAELHQIYQSVLFAGSFTDFSAKTGLVFDLIISACDEVCKLDDENLSLEQKVTLSVGIRLLAEEVLIARIDDPEYVANISRNQTGKLIRKYERGGNCDENILRAVKRVALMTPENIHLNSFMFEPILDMSGHHLKLLYSDISAFTQELA